MSHVPYPQYCQFKHCIKPPKFIYLLDEVQVVAPAIEYKAEGQVFGIGCKIFTIAGPVILYGILSSWVLGVIYWVGKVMGGI